MRRTTPVWIVGAMLAVILVSPAAYTRELPQAQWLHSAPSQVDFAIALPDLGAFEEDLAGLALHPAITNGWTFDTFRDLLLTSVQGEEKPETLAAFLRSAGVDTAQGAVLYFEVTSGLYGASLAVSSRDAATLRLGELGAGQPVDVGLEDAGATFISAKSLGFFFHEDRLFLASTPDFLKVLAAPGSEGPSSLLLGDDAPEIGADAVLVQMNLDNLTGDELTTEDSAAAIQGLIEAWRARVDAAFLAVSFNDGATQLRLISHDSPYTPPAGQTPAAAEASAQAWQEARAKEEAKRGPMTMAPYLPNDSLAVVDLRLTKSLKTLAEQVVKATMIDQTQAAQVVGGVNIAFSMLGDEAAIALTDYTSAPDLLLLAPSKNSQQLKGFLPMAGVKEPLTNENGVDIFGIPNIPTEGQTLYVAPANNLIVVGSQMDSVKAILSAGGQPPAGGGYGNIVPEALLQYANDGFVIVQGDKIAQLANQLAPQIVTDPAVVLGDLTLALHAEGEWNETRLEVPDLAPFTDEVGASIESRQQDAASAESRDHLLGLLDAAKAYAADHDGAFPPLSETAGNLMMADGAVRPGYLKDLWLTLNPGAADVAAAEAALRERQTADDTHYVYFSHALPDEAAGLQFAEAYKSRMEEGQSLKEDWAAEGKPTLFRIDSTVVEDLSAAADAPAPDAAEAPAEETTEAAVAPAITAAQIPVFMERPGAWPDGQIHVVYLDGQVQAIARGTYPNTDAFLKALADLDALEAQEAEAEAPAGAPAETSASEAEGTPAP